MLLLSEADVVQLLPVDEAVELVRAAFVAYSRGEIICPQRLPLPLHPPGAVLLSMPAFDGRQYAGVKLVSVQPQNAARGMPIVRASYQLFDAATGEPLALMAATALTAIRTGAAGGLAADLLALPGAETLALIGTGAQAETQLLAAIAVRPIRDVWISSRDPRHVEEFIERMAPRMRVHLHAAPSGDEAVRHAMIVVTATNAALPVFDDQAVRAGTHITAVGSFTATMQEIPDATVARAAVYVDADEAIWHEAGELAGPLARGLITRDHPRGEIGALAAGAIPGRHDETEITLFKSAGLAAQDLICAAAVYRRAQEADVGVRASL
ncbi:MAG TPA: ornithine cyclodeaminase family protein [Chloroflexota bacterium]|nr:ornithine cyclodeaminase family protein [Chloroflexota bacterium]